jgi:hypothetical protein
LRRLAKIFDSMIEHGITPPGNSKEWIDKILELQLSRFPDGRVVFDPGPDSVLDLGVPPAAWSS